MKNNHKIKIIQVVILLVFLFIPIYSQAITWGGIPFDVGTNNLGSDLPQVSNPLDNPKLNVGIPGFTGFRDITCDDPTSGSGLSCVVPWLADYMNSLYRYGIGIIIIFAVIIMMIAGVMWITAGGNETRVHDAKRFIGGSILGIFIAISSYMILNIINPALTELSPIKLEYIREEVLQQLEPEDLTSEILSLPQGSNGTGQGDYKLPIYYQGSYDSVKNCMGGAGCGPTALSMIVNHYGIKKTPPQIATDAQGFKCWSCGGWTGGIPCFQRLLKKYDPSLKTMTGGSFEDIKNLLTYGPVLASIENLGSKKRGAPSRCPFTGGGHYVVFTGYSNGTFYTNDPNGGNRGKTNAITESSFIGKCGINMGVMAVYK